MTVIRKKGNINPQSIKTFSCLTLSNRQENSYLISLDYLWHTQKFEASAEAWSNYEWFASLFYKPVHYGSTRSAHS